MHLYHAFTDERELLNNYVEINRDNFRAFQSYQDLNETDETELFVRVKPKNDLNILILRR